VVALLGAIVLAALAVAFVDAPQLRVRSVTATVPPGGPVRTGDVLAAAHVPPDANLWLLDTGAMRRRIGAIPYVLDVASHRAQFPQPAIVFAVTLRTPTGCVRTASGVVTIDATARVLQQRCASLADAKIIGGQVPVRIVRRDRFGGLEAVETDDVIIKFGADDDLAAKLALIGPIRRSTASAKKLRAIDVRSPDTPVVEFP
jgi:hypothetical protein